MGIFQRKEKANQAVKKEEAGAKDFERRIPFWNYRAVDYKNYEPFFQFRAEIDGYLEKLFAGEIDDGNGNVLDCIIGDMARQAEKDLARQRTEHRDMIKSFDIRAQSDRRAFENQLSLLKDYLAENRKKQEKYRVHVEANEFMRTEESI